MKADPSISEKQIWQALEQVKDPEIPVLSLIDLGIVEKVDIVDNKISIVIIPTYSGCPALDIMKKSIIEVIEKLGYERVSVAIDYSISWTTDRMGKGIAEKLRKYGIAPPSKDVNTIECPRCGSRETTLKSFFGATACKSQYVCQVCKEPFEYFKFF